MCYTGAVRAQIGIGILLCVGCVAASAVTEARGDDAPPDDMPMAPAGERERAWCAPELISLSEGVCVVVPSRLVEPREVVVFLHGVIKPDSDWQFAQQRAVARAARTHGFVAVMPRGRRGVGPSGMQQWWTWPTSAAAQGAIEDELITEWTMAERAVEAALGKSFERRYLFGFSNGAYYASSLALRGRVVMDGYGIFAGGSSAGYLAQRAREVRDRSPIYVGFGNRDGEARGDAAKFAGVLAALHWPHRAVGRPRVGHTMTDSMVTEALEFFRAGGNDPKK